jgi:branched-chain amino acid transport system substrate-binding protein
MRKTRFWISLLFAMLLVLALYGAQLGQSGQTKKLAGEPIIIGGAIALTGGFSAYDLENRAGAELAVEDINKAGGLLGGRPLQYLVEDTKSDRAVGPTVATDLLSKGAVAMITQCDFDFGAPAALVAQAKKVPSFSCASSPKFGVQGIGPYAYDVSVTTQAEGAVMAEWPYKNLKARTAYVLVDTTLAYDTDDCKAFVTRWKQLPGTRIVGQDKFQNGDASIASQITRIRSLSKAPDLVEVCTYLPGGISAIRQIRAAGIKSPIMTGIGMDGTSWFKPIAHLSNVYFTNYGSEYGDDKRPFVNKFFQRFKAKAGHPANVSYSLVAYCQVQVIAAAIKAAGSTDGDKMRQALDKFKNVPCDLGTVTYTPKKHWVTTFKVQVAQITNSKGKGRDLVSPVKPPPPTF